MRTSWWRRTGRSAVGCQALALDPRGHVLLVRHTYGQRAWTLPIGAAEPGEDPVMTASRELAEETGCTFTAPRLIGTREFTTNGVRHRVHVVAGHAQGTPRADLREIAEAGWFAPDALPHPVARGLPDLLAEWIARFEEGRD